MGQYDTCAAVTGHRPNRLGGYGPEVHNRLLDLAHTALTSTPIDRLHVGMALGWDQACAQVATGLGIPFVAYLPFRGQEKAWPSDAQQRYGELLSKAKSVRVVTPRIDLSDLQEIRRAMFARNLKMLEGADILHALWNGSRSGTGHCVRHAKIRNIQLFNWWDDWTEMTTESH